MTRTKKRNIIILILLVLIVIIWFFNVRVLLNIGSRSREIKMPSREGILALDSLPKYDFVFKDLKNDPFNALLQPSDTLAKASAMPMFTLRGVVLAGDGALALMELSDGNIYPMKRGETYLGVKIKKITPKEVTIEFRGKQEKLSVLQ